ncbi:MAG: aminopeptidase P family protein [Gemmatimonadetes bacterium]|nr:aminopeptidase P family protein [Gemmatimonadota bacterium]
MTRHSAPRAKTLLLLPFVALTPVLSGCSSEGPPAAEVPYVHPGSLVENSEYAARRQRLMDEIPDGIAIIPGATSHLAGDQFFQSNDFFYFSGVEAPNAWLVVDGVNRTSTLFLTLDEHDARGEGLPPELATDPAAFTGIEAAHPVEEMQAVLADLGREIGVFYLSHRPEELPGMNTNEVFNAYQRTITDNAMDGRLTRELQLADRLMELFPGVEIRDCFLPIQVMRKVKSPAEVDLVREAAQIGVKAHLDFMRSTQVGMPEQALAALFEFVSKREGARSLAYETIIMAGPHHPWGHYHKHDRTLEDGDFIILDAGPDYAYYNADISTSFPANGRFTAEQRELYELGLGIHKVCLDNYRPGTTFAAVGREVEAWLTEQGYDSSENRFRGLIRWGCYNHPIGMATHDVMASMTGPDEPLEPGFVFACDINMPQTETLGIRIEDTVVITEDGYENLSAGLPRTVAEIEAFMREDGLLQKVGR